MSSPATSRVGNGGCPGPMRQTELKRPARSAQSISAARRTNGWRRVDDLTKRWAKDRPDDRRAAGSRLPSNSESAVKRNHETPKSRISKRKKIEACPRLSCKIQYMLASNHRDQSTNYEYFTDDSIAPGEVLRTILSNTSTPLSDPLRA
jgi:hypothetical protein